MCNVNALFCTASAFFLSKVARLKGSAERALLQVSCLLEPDIILGKIEAFSSFTPFKESSLNSKNACGVHQTLHFPVFVCLFLHWAQSTINYHWSVE